MVNGHVITGRDIVAGKKGATDRSIVMGNKELNSRSVKG